MDSDSVLSYTSDTIKDETDSVLSYTSYTIKDETDSDEEYEKKHNYEDKKLYTKSKIDESKCKYRTPCIKHFKDALVDNTKEDPLFYTTLSGITAAVGLATNSPATIIGSMLLSPIGDIIVRLSLILNFNAQKYFKKTDNDFSRQAFQERFLENLGIQSKFIYINNDDKGKLNIQLKSIKSSEKGRICEIYRYRERVYFLYENEKVLYNVYGEPKFAVIRNSDTENLFQKNERRRFRELKDEYIPERRSFGKIYKLPSGIITDDDIPKILRDKFSRDELDITNLNDEFNYIPLRYIQRKIHKYEKQDFIPWTNDTFIGKKYKFWDVLGWGVVVCLWAIVIGIICALCFGKFQIDQTKEKKSEILDIKEQIKQTNNLEEKKDLQLKLKNLESDRIPWFSIPTKEMSDRTKINNAIGMIFIAICSGIILPEAVKHKNSTKMVGIGIATALLPPLVNIGMYIGIMILILDEDNKENIEMSHDDLINSVITGIIIFFINFVIILGISAMRLYSYCDTEDNGIFKSFGLC